MDLVMCKIDNQAHDEDNLNNTDGNTCNSCNHYWCSQRFNNYFGGPPECFSFDNCKAGNGQCSDSADEEKYLKILFHFFNFKREYQNNDEYTYEQNIDDCDLVHWFKSCAK